MVIVAWVWLWEMINLASTSLWQSFLRIVSLSLSFFCLCMMQEYYFYFVMFTAMHRFMNIGIIWTFRAFDMSWAYKACFLFHTAIIDEKFHQFCNQPLHGLLPHLPFSSPLFMCGNVTSGDGLIVPFLEVIPTGISFRGLNFLLLSKWHFQAHDF